MSDLNAVLLAIQGGISSLPYLILYLLIVVDIFSGTGRAFYQRRLNSSTGLSGIIKHTTLAVAISIIFPVAELLGLSIIIKSILIVISLNYVLSILENIEAVTDILPDFISKRIYNLKENTVKNIELSIMEDDKNFHADIKIDQDRKEQFKTETGINKTPDKRYFHRKGQND